VEALVIVVERYERVELGIEHWREGIDKDIDTVIALVVAGCGTGKVECEGWRDECQSGYEG
jgi:hypothetical protein